jgi:signal transduction protein with GAF and PtsI domain
MEPVSVHCWLSDRGFTYRDYTYAQVKKASIYVLVIEELTDLLYELNDIYNLQREVNCEYGEQLHHRVMKAIFYVAFGIEVASQHTELPREMDELIRATIRYQDQDGYVDRGDLQYAIEKARIHVSRMNMAYKKELDVETSAILQVIQLLLTDTNYLLYGTTGSVQTNSGGSK